MAPIKSFAGKFAKAAFAVSAPNSSAKRATTISAGDISSLCLEKMCKLFKAAPADNLYLSAGGERGVRLRKSVEKGDPVLSIPIESCFRDDEPPGWYERPGDDGSNSDEHDITDYERYNPSGWASRLAASMLDLEIIDNGNKKNQGGEGEIMEIIDDDLKLGREIWQSMLPDKDILRASLPVHWGEEVLATSKCTALEMAVDSSYFARAGAVMDLSEELKNAVDCKDGDDEEIMERKCNDEALDIAMDMEPLQRKCHDALDIVQTRACRVERTFEDGVQWGPPLRILAPIFDFINHGSSRTKGEGSANACFGIENERMCDMHDAKLVVRAVRDISEGEEVLIDYGDSARPGWRCLSSYGFVPEYDINSELVDEEHVENVAELWMNGLRFEVDPHSVPFDLVEVAAAQSLLDSPPKDKELEEDEESGIFTPVVALAIAQRATEAAFNLITEPEMVDSEEEWDDPEFVHASSLAALLRWSQHKVLLAFAENLNELFPSPAASEAE